MNTENQFKKGQKVWVKARIVKPEPDEDGDIKVHITSSLSLQGEIYCYPSAIRTTEQIVQEHGASSPQKAPDGTISLRLCLTEEEYKHMKCCVSSHEPFGEYEEKLIEQIKAKLGGRDEQNKKGRKKSKYKKGEKFYIEVEVDVVAGKDSAWVIVPDHPKNEYDGLCVYTKNLISKKDIEKEKEEAYHKGHGDGYDMGFSALMF